MRHQDKPCDRDRRRRHRRPRRGGGAAQVFLRAGGLRAGRGVCPRRRRHPAEPECREGASLARHRGAPAAGRVRAGDLAQPRRAVRQGHQRPSARPRGRGALRRALPDACIAATCTRRSPSIVPAQSIRLGKKLAASTPAAARVELTFADGSEAEADAVIGADGVHSLVRDHVAGPEQPRFTGRLAYRTTFPVSLLARRRYRLARAPNGGARTATSWSISSPPQRDEVYFTTSLPEKADWMTQGILVDEGRPRRDARGVRELSIPTCSACSRPRRRCTNGRIYERDPLPDWSKGRVVLLGDACHPMTPYMASGAAMALEDAVVLARAIDQADSFEAAFRLYETARKPRASVVQAGSSKNTWMRSETNPDWLYGYDASRVPLRSSLAADASTYYESMTLLESMTTQTSSPADSSPPSTKPAPAARRRWATAIWSGASGATASRWCCCMAAPAAGCTGCATSRTLSRDYMLLVPDIPGSGESASAAAADHRGEGRRGAAGRHRCKSSGRTARFCDRRLLHGRADLGLRGKARRRARDVPGAGRRGRHHRARATRWSR